MKSYEERLAEATAYCDSCIVTDNLAKQKFKRGQIIKVDDEMPPSMSHFIKGFYGVVNYTYGQKFGCDNIDSYSLIVLDDNKPINSSAWYHEYQLTLVEKDTKLGLKLIEIWENRRRI